MALFENWQMYDYATLKQVTNLENDAVALKLLVHKLKDNLETIFSTEFSNWMANSLLDNWLVQNLCLIWSYIMAVKNN